MGISFFSRKGRMQTSRPLASLLNTMNMLGPFLLLGAVVLLLTSWWKVDDPQLDDVMNRWAVGLSIAALLLRVVWGLAIWRIRRKAVPDADSR